MKEKATYTLRSLITELFCKVHSNEMDIPEAVESLMKMIEGGVTLPTEEIPKSKIEPLFEIGTVPVMGYCEIQEIRPRRTGGWRYFVYNKKHTYSTGWMTEDELIRRIEQEKKHTT